MSVRSQRAFSVLESDFYLKDLELYCVEDEFSRKHREAFVALIDKWMHQRVRFRGLNRATLFSGRLNAAKVWCYVPERSALEIVSTNSEPIPSNIHSCPNWPPNLLPCVDLNVKSSRRHFCEVECDGCGIDIRRGAFLNTQSFSPFPLPPGCRIRVFGLWLFENRYLQPGIFTSWRNENDPFMTYPPSVHLDATPPAECALRLALMAIFSPPPDAMDSSCQEKASLWTESAFRALFDNTRNGPLPAIHLADRFIHLHKHAPSPHLGHLLLTTGDLGGVSSVFHSVGEPVNLSGRTFQLFEPLATSQEVILTGRLEMNAATGALMIGPIFNPNQSSNVPLPLLSSSPIDLGIQSLFNEVVLIRRPRLVVAVTSDKTSTVCAFGQCLATLPRLCVICDAALKVLSVDAVGGSDPPFLPSVEMATEPILLRYVSSPKNLPPFFNIRYESAGDARGNSDGPSSSSLHCLQLHSSAALWAFARGLFSTGYRIHLSCVRDGGVGPQVVSEPINVPWTSDCHHLVGLYQWRILSVQEVQYLLKCNRQQQQQKWISMQGYVLRHKLLAPNSGDLRGIRLWLIDRYSIDPSASSPLRIDFIAPNSTYIRAITEISRLPCLTHVCLFKVCLLGGRLLLPPSPNRLQISPIGLSSYFSADASWCFCSCFPRNVNNPVCSVCTMRASTRTTIGATLSSLPLPSPMDLLCEPEGRKTCLVHIIRCLKFGIFRLEESVNIHLKILISDGSATGVASFNCNHPPHAFEYPGISATPSLHWLVALLGLEESLTRQVVTHLASVQENAEDAVRIGLDAWLDSPGFLRPISLTLEKAITSGEKGYWRLNTVSVGREVRLAIAPLQKLCVVCQ